MAVEARGVCRIELPRPAEDEAIVREDWGDNEWRIKRSDYVARGTQPPFNSLPLCPGFGQI